MDEILTIKNDLGEEKEFDILFTFESEKNNKKYVTYTDYSKDENNNIICYSGYYEEENLLPVTDEDDLKFIDNLLNTLTEETRIKYTSKKE